MPFSVKRNKIMKNITLYVDNGTYLTRLHPYTKLVYILTAICTPLLIGQIRAFCAFILCNILILLSTKLLKKGSTAYHLFLYDTADHFYHSWSVQLP